MTAEKLRVIYLSALPSEMILTLMNDCGMNTESQSVHRCSYVRVAGAAAVVGRVPSEVAVVFAR